MRFMMLMIPAGYETAAPDSVQQLDADAVAAMMKYNEELRAAGVLVALGWIALVLGAGLAAVALPQRTFVPLVEVAPEGQVSSVRAPDSAYTPTAAPADYFPGQFVDIGHSHVTH